MESCWLALDMVLNSLNRLVFPLTGLLLNGYCGSTSKVARVFSGLIIACGGMLRRAAAAFAWAAVHSSLLKSGNGARRPLGR
jgi:hypothetical protein